VDINLLKDDAVIFTDVEYGKFIEYGTSKFNARKHFNNTKDRQKTPVLNIFKKAMSSI